MKRYTEEQVYELARAVESSDVLGQYRRRVQAVYCLALGDDSFTVAERSRFCERSIRNFQSRYFAQGLPGLKSNYVGSNYRKLTYTQEAEALEKLSETAGLGAYARCKELAVELEKLTGTRYQIDAFRELLKRHGWRKVAPRGAHPKKATVEAIEASKKLTFWSTKK